MPTRSLTGKTWRALTGHEPRRVSRWCYPSDFEPNTKEPPVVRWRKVVLGPDGPASPTTRLVLLTLSYHMDERGGSCFPSCDLLTMETRLSKRAVIKHLQFAETEGWIERTMAMGHGKGWKRAEYQATVPSFGGDARSPRTKHRSRRKVDPLLGGYSDDTSW